MLGMEESKSPYASIGDLARDLAGLQTILTLMQLGANLTLADEEEIDSITIRLLRWAEDRGATVEIDRYKRVRSALRARFAPS